MENPHERHDSRPYQAAINEEYCIQLARCMLSATKTSQEMKEIALSSEFSSCLREEEGEAK